MQSQIYQNLIMDWNLPILKKIQKIKRKIKIKLFSIEKDKQTSPFLNISISKKMNKIRSMFQSLTQQLLID